MGIARNYSDAGAGTRGERVVMSLLPGESAMRNAVSDDLRPDLDRFRDEMESSRRDAAAREALLQLEACTPRQRRFRSRLTVRCPRGCPLAIIYDATYDGEIVGLLHLQRERTSEAVYLDGPTRRPSQPRVGCRHGRGWVTREALAAVVAETERGATRSIEKIRPRTGQVRWNEKGPSGSWVQ